MVPDSAAEDRLLMQRIAQGEAAALHRLIDKYSARALRAMQRYLGERMAAEDAVQEAFTAVWRQAGRWRPEAAFSTWFYAILFNQARQRHRDRLFHGATLDEALPDPQPTAEYALQRKEQWQAFDQALQDLPERQRAALVLFYFEGLNQQEACAVMGIKLGAFESLLSRGRAALKQRLAPQGH